VHFRPEILENRVTFLHGAAIGIRAKSGNAATETVALLGMNDERFGYWGISYSGQCSRRVLTFSAVWERHSRQHLNGRRRLAHGTLADLRPQISMQLLW
jgi:hypothetical protein